MIEINGIEVRKWLDWKQILRAWLPFGVESRHTAPTSIRVPLSVQEDPVDSLTRRLRPRLSYSIETENGESVLGTPLSRISFVNNRAILHFEEMILTRGVRARCAVLCLDGHPVDSDSPLHNAQIVPHQGFSLQYEFKAHTLNDREIPVTVDNLWQLLSIWQIDQGYVA